MTRFQYHATTEEAAQRILQDGFRLPDDVHVRTHRFSVPSISTADSPTDAAPYGPVILRIGIDPSAQYAFRSFRRDARRGETVEETMDRWLAAARSAGQAGVMVREWQSTVGNQTIDPSVFLDVEVLSLQSESSLLTLTSLVREIIRSAG